MSLLAQSQAVINAIKHYQASAAYAAMLDHGEIVQKPAYCPIYPDTAAAALKSSQRPQGA